MLLLDEPTAGLDAASAAAVEALVARRRATAGTGVVWVTHDAAQAYRVARRWLTLADGRLAGRAAP